MPGTLTPTAVKRICARAAINRQAVDEFRYEKNELLSDDVTLADDFCWELRQQLPDEYEFSISQDHL